jgi:CRP/FNR family cyclic AMP-dependent transcriptional regulator
MELRSSRPIPEIALDDLARAAVEASHLRSLAPEVLASLVADATRLSIPAGSTTHREGERSSHFEIVIYGLVRAYVTAPDGRTMTVRYCRPGAIIGAVSLFASSFALPATVQTVTDTELLALRPSVVQRSAERDARVARALLDELSERVLSFIAEISGGSFTTVRQRVSRHLLDLASERQEGSVLVAAVGQQDLADAVGSPREVVVRALRELRQEGAIKTQRGAIVLLDPDRLASEGYGAAGTEVPTSRNRGR